MSLEAILVCTVIVAVVGVPLAELITRWAEEGDE